MQLFTRYAPLPKASLVSLQSIATRITLSKGTLLMRSGYVETKFYLIEKGLVRAYEVRTDGNEVIFWFGMESDVIISMNSYVHQAPGYENIELLEEGVLWEFSVEELRKLYLTDIHIANWGRHIAEHELLRTEKALISRLFKTATERYQDLLQQQPSLFQRVSLGYIASYLGMTQVSLSRIRAQKV
jgi:CRP-like cAMP-binding protein